MKPQIVFFTELLGPSLIINLAQLVSLSVALPAELVLLVVVTGGKQSQLLVLRPTKVDLGLQVRIGGRAKVRVLQES